jgi:hypothetical protein
VRLSSLRARLFAAISLVALLSLALALAIGAVLTRRAVERNTLQDVSAKFDLLVEREKDAILPFSRLPSFQAFLETHDEQIVPVPLDGSGGLLSPEQVQRLRRGARLDGTLETDGTRYLYAARLVNNRGYMLLRPASSTNSAWRPHVQGLIVAAAATAALAALIASCSPARSPVPSAVSRKPPAASPARSSSRRSSPSRARASSRSSRRASTRSPWRWPRRGRRSARSSSP